MNVNTITLNTVNKSGLLLLGLFLIPNIVVANGTECVLDTLVSVAAIDTVTKSPYCPQLFEHVYWGCGGQTQSTGKFCYKGGGFGGLLKVKKDIAEANPGAYTDDLIIACPSTMSCSDPAHPGRHQEACLGQIELDKKSILGLSIGNVRNFLAAVILANNTPAQIIELQECPTSGSTPHANTNTTPATGNTVSNNPVSSTDVPAGSGGGAGSGSSIPSTQPSTPTSPLGSAGTGSAAQNTAQTAPAGGSTVPSTAPSTQPQSAPTYDSPTSGSSNYQQPSYSSWDNQQQNTVASNQGTTNQNNYGYGSAGQQTPTQNPFSRMVNTFLNPTPAYVPPQNANGAADSDDSEEANGNRIAFSDIYNILTGQNRPQAEAIPPQDTTDGITLSRITFRTDEFGEIHAYGVSKEELKKILKDVAGHEVTATSMPTVTSDDGKLFVEAPESDTETAPVPDWLKTFVQSGGSATADYSGIYGYVTSPDSKTVDVYEKDEGKFVTVQKDKDGNTKVGLQDKDGNTVFLPEGGILDIEADWSDFTDAFVDIAGRAPEHTIDMASIPLTPFDVAIRELYGDDALEHGVPFSSDSPKYTVGKNGELIPIEVIDAAMKVAKDRAGVTGLQKAIRDGSEDKIEVATAGSSFPLDTNIDTSSVRIMPIAQQVLTLARIKGEMEARGHENIDEALRVAIFNTYDSTAKKITGVTAFTVRVDEDGNKVSKRKVTFSLGTLVREMFAEHASAQEPTTFTNNPITRLIGSLFTVESPVKEDLQNSNVHRIKLGDDVEKTQQSIGGTALDMIVSAVAAPFKFVASLFK